MRFRYLTKITTESQPTSVTQHARLANGAKLQATAKLGNEYVFNFRSRLDNPNRKSRERSAGVTFDVRVDRKSMQSIVRLPFSFIPNAQSTLFRSKISNVRDDSNTEVPKLAGTRSAYTWYVHGISNSEHNMQF